MTTNNSTVYPNTSNACNGVWTDAITSLARGIYNSDAGAYLQFQFQSNIIVSAVKVYAQWNNSNSVSNWQLIAIDAGNNQYNLGTFASNEQYCFTANSSPYVTMNWTNTTAYPKYQLLFYSGSLDNGNNPTINEIEFGII